MSNQLIKIDFDQEQVALIKQQIAPTANQNELKLFLYQCKRTGLDPLTRQIYCIHRAGKMTIQTSIDGFRVIAERSGAYAGQDEPVWVDDEKGLPIKCTVKVYRFAPDGQRYCAGVGVAYFKEYYPNPMNLQKSMPHTMIAKVAEALALRKAFPQDLSGLYTSEEMSNNQEVEPITVDGEATVMQTPPNPVKKRVSDKAFSDGIARLKAGEMAMFELLNTYALSEEQNTTLVTTYSQLTTPQ